MAPDAGPPASGSASLDAGTSSFATADTTAPQQASTLGMTSGSLPVPARTTESPTAASIQRSIVNNPLGPPPGGPRSRPLGLGDPIVPGENPYGPMWTDSSDPATTATAAREEIPHAASPQRVTTVGPILADLPVVPLHSPAYERPSPPVVARLLGGDPPSSFLTTGLVGAATEFPPSASTSAAPIAVPVPHAPGPSPVAAKTLTLTARPPVYVQMQRLSASMPPPHVPLPAVPEPVLQRVSTSEAGPQAPVGEPFPVTVQMQQEGATPPSQGNPATAAVGGEPDSLLAKLYDPLLRRLKAELRIDRERYGMLSDIRR